MLRINSGDTRLDLILVKRYSGPVRCHWICIAIRPVEADGNCGYSSLKITREEFIAAVRKQQKGANADFDLLRAQAFEELGVRTVEEWADEYRRVMENGHAVHWLDITHMRMLSFLFNVHIQLFTIDAYEGDALIPLPGDEGVIYEGLDPTNRREVRLLWMGLQPGTQPVHFEEVLLTGASSMTATSK